MPKFFVKQPDGKFALFSTVVDDFLETGMSEEEAVEAATDNMEVSLDQVEDIIGKARRDEPFWPSEDRGDGLNRWRQALVPLAIQHGMETVNARMREMGLDETAIPEQAIRAAEEARIAKLNIRT
ncbi:hypothetical protein OIU34_22860 [Pararhizobium sp. BT-229]|uniref:hypothetical protein n=1 Tax=Pararhizobium sp. BT-229 TaxID=2986923 RepID=UPI0021F7652B|nr:hypothetical protein [Pararhizobium sp. BT-229]MCV9964736.1 hypothetical protein [Pararhizobium sp. BT-229]